MFLPSWWSRKGERFLSDRLTGTVLLLGRRQPFPSRKSTQHAFGGSQVINDVVKMTDGGLIEGGNCLLVAKEALGRHDDQRFCGSSLTWRRRRWKYCAGVEGTVTWMFSSAYGSKESLEACA